MPSGWLDEVYVSTSNRAIQTAQPFCDLTGMEAEQLDWLNEKYAYRTLSLINGEGERVWGVEDPETRKLWASRQILDLGHNWYTHPAFSDTSFRSGIERINRETDAFLAQFGYIRDEEHLCYRTESDWKGKVAVFAHAGVGGAILSHIFGIPYPHMILRSSMDLSGVNVIGFKQTQGFVFPQIITYSNDSHLYREGYPTRF